MLRHCPLPSLTIKSMQKKYFLVWQVLLYHSNPEYSIFKLCKGTENSLLSYMWFSQSFLTSEFWSDVGVHPPSMNGSEKVFPKSPCSGLFFEHSGAYQGCNEAKKTLFTISSTLTLFLPGLLSKNGGKKLANMHFLILLSITFRFRNITCLGGKLRPTYSYPMV